MTNSPENPKPAPQLGWYRVFGFISAETISASRKITIICACILGIAGAITAVNSGLNSLRRSADAAKAQLAAQIEAARVLGATEERKAQAELQKAEMEQAAAAAKAEHDKILEAKVDDTRKLLDGRTALITSIATDTKKNSESIKSTEIQVKALRLDVAALLKEKGIEPHAVATGATQ